MAEDFFGNLSKTLKKTVDTVGKKTDEFVEIQKIRTRQHALEDQIEKNYQDIGQIIYNRYLNGEAFDENLAGICKDITDLEKEIADCREDVANKRGRIVCPACGASVPKDAAFCMRCGAAMPAKEEEPEDAAYEPEPEMDEDAGPEPEEDLENTQEMNARLEEERLEKEIRSMSREEKQLFASFVPTRGAMKKLVRALDQLSLAAYTGNLIITGDPGSDTLNLAKNIVKDVRAKDHNFSGKLAKIEGDAFNKKDAGELVVKLAGGALVIDNAGEIDDEGAGRLMDALNQEQTGILVILIDTKRNIKKLISANPEMESFFNARFDIEALDNGTLVAYGCQYAKMQEYAIDELGRLALHTRIEDMQTSDHIVTVNDVRDIVDEAIDHANRKTPKHFMDVLLAKRYDDDDMIILHEGDFI